MWWWKVLVLIASTASSSKTVSATWTFTCCTAQLLTCIFNRSAFEYSHVFHFPGCAGDLTRWLTGYRIHLTIEYDSVHLYCTLLPATRVLLKFGALCDGKTLDTVALQTAFLHGSDTQQQVVIPAGKTCLTNPLNLSSNLSIYFQQGSVLKAGPSNTWPNATHRGSAEFNFSGVPMLSGGFDAPLTNVSIAGNGTIDGMCQLYRRCWQIFFVCQE